MELVVRDADEVGTLDQFSAVGATIPANPDRLLKVAVYVADWPELIVRLFGLTETLKFPLPLFQSSNR